MLGKAVIRDRLNSAINKTQALVSQLTSTDDIRTNSTSLSEKLQTTLDITLYINLQSCRFRANACQSDAICLR